MELGVLEPRHLFPEESQELLDLPVSFQLGHRQLHPTRGVLAEHPGRVEVDHIFLQPVEKQHILARAVDLPPPPGLVIQPADLLPLGHALPVHLAQLEAQRHRLTVPRRPPQLELAPRPGRQIRVPGAVHIRRGPGCGKPGLRKQHQPGDIPIHHHHIRQVVVIQNLDPGLQTQILRRQRSRVLGNIPLLPLPGPVLAHPLHPFAVHRAVQRLLIHMVGHERMHLPDRRHPA